MITKKHSKLRAFISAMRRVLARLNNSYKLVSMSDIRDIEVDTMRAKLKNLRWRIDNGCYSNPGQLIELHNQISQLKKKLALYGIKDERNGKQTKTVRARTD